MAQEIEGHRLVPFEGFATGCILQHVLVILVYTIHFKSYSSLMAGTLKGSPIKYKGDAVNFYLAPQGILAVKCSS